MPNFGNVPAGLPRPLVAVGRTNQFDVDHPDAVDDVEMRYPTVGEDVAASVFPLVQYAKVLTEPPESVDPDVRQVPFTA